MINVPDTQRAVDVLRERLDTGARVCVVLGSGLARVVDVLEDARSVPFTDVPGLPGPGVAGHEGRFVSGRLGGVAVLFQCGRFHLYEGLEPSVVAAPTRLAAALGVEILVLTNAAGGLRSTLEPGELVLISDHINLTGRNPLAGPAVLGEPRFPDMTEPYDGALRAVAHEVAASVGVAVRDGVYAGVLGPSFETAAEVRMLASLGADVVGMSTVTEVIAARAAGMRCIALSLVTNKGTGLSDSPLTHEEVIETGRVASAKLGALLAALAPALAEAMDRGSRSD